MIASHRIGAVDSGTLLRWWLRLMGEWVILQPLHSLSVPLRYFFSLISFHYPLSPPNSFHNFNVFNNLVLFPLAYPRLVFILSFLNHNIVFYLFFLCDSTISVSSILLFLRQPSIQSFSWFPIITSMVFPIYDLLLRTLVLVLSKSSLSAL